MSTEFFNDQWRIPSNENQNKISNYSMDFDGTSAEIDLGTAVVLDTSIAFSFSSWVNLKNYTNYAFPYVAKLKTNEANGWRIMLSQASGYQGITIGNSNTFAKVRTSGDISQDFLNSWNHIVVTYNGSGSNTISNWKIYVNGSSVSLTASSIIGNDANTSFIGSGDGQRFFIGQIDQVSIFDYELSQDQVTQLGAEGYAFNFIPNDRINVGNDSSLNITGDLTISIWVKTTSTAIQGLISKVGSATTRSYALYIYYSSGLSFVQSYVSTDGTTYAFTGKGLTGGISVHDGNWHNIIMVNDPTTTNNYLYVDGVEVMTTTNGRSIFSSTVDTNIGFLDPSYYFNGELSNAQIFNSVIPPTGSNSVQTIYNNGKPLSDMSGFTSLQGWWKLDDTATFNSGTSVWSIPDASTNSNTGASVGMNASNLVASNIDGELISNPMALSPKPIAYYQLGDQSVDNGANYLVPNNSLSDYVFNFVPSLVNFGTTIFNFDRTDPFTFSIWIKTSSNGTNQYVISKQIPNYLGYMFLLDSSLKIGAVFSHNTNARIYFVSNSAIPSNEWVHLVWTYSGNSLASGMSVYANGAPFAITTVYDNLTLSPTNSGQLNISGRDGSFHREVNGELSNFSIFDTELSSTQVETLYNNGAPGDISSLNPNGWWKLNAADTFDGTDWTINDYGSGGNDGISNGMTSANLVVSDLQQTSGFSPYALDFSGITANLKTYTIPAATNTVTLSAWVKRTGASGSYAGVFGVRNSAVASPAFGLCWQISFGNNDNKIRFRTSADVSSAWQEVVQNDVMPDDTWHHVAGVADGTNLKIYINGVLQTDTKTQTNGTLQSPTSNIFFAMQGPAGSNPFNGQLSNCARWNIGLTQAEVTEIYNQGVPSNLNNFSGTTPIGWWQLGSNSSFEGNDWTCLDEIGTDYADSGTTAMTNDDIVDGVGYSASGLGTSSIDIKGDAPYSTANGLSENMDVLDRTIDVPG